jgi:hypothetical protein
MIGHGFRSGRLITTSAPTIIFVNARAHFSMMALCCPFAMVSGVLLIGTGHIEAGLAGFKSTFERPGKINQFTSEPGDGRLETVRRLQS